jgi:uncharacterized membrane protein
MYCQPMIEHLGQHPAGALHLVSALFALICGAAVLLRQKGTRGHVCMGYIYAGSMLLTNLSALAIYDLFQRPGPFHILALLSLVSVIAGLVPAWRRPPGWQAQHARLVIGSYVGLCAAAVAEISSHLLDFPFSLTVTSASALVIVVGLIWSRRHVARRFPKGNY